MISSFLFNIAPNLREILPNLEKGALVDVIKVDLFNRIILPLDIRLQKCAKKKSVFHLYRLKFDLLMISYFESSGYN